MTFTPDPPDLPFGESAYPPDPPDELEDEASALAFVEWQEKVWEQEGIEWLP